jgi:hypothetical protein
MAEAEATGVVARDLARRGELRPLLRRDEQLGPQIQIWLDEAAELTDVAVAGNGRRALRHLDAARAEIVDERLERRLVGDLPADRADRMLVGWIERETMVLIVDPQIDRAVVALQRLHPENALREIQPRRHVCNIERDIAKT